MIIKEYFGVEICCVQCDMPYLHLWVLNKLLRHLCDKVCLKIIYKCVYYRVLHKIQFGESASQARNLILAFENAAQTHIVSMIIPHFITIHKLSNFVGVKMNISSCLYSYV